MAFDVVVRNINPVNVLQDNVVAVEYESLIKLVTESMKELEKKVVSDVAHRKDHQIKHFVAPFIDKQKNFTVNLFHGALEVAQHLGLVFLFDAFRVGKAQNVVEVIRQQRL